MMKLDRNNFGGVAVLFGEYLLNAVCGEGTGSSARSSWDGYAFEWYHTLTIAVHAELTTHRVLSPAGCHRYG